ncbi:MAG TPA: GerMN domain-containing protein [Candidatus Saccharimonadales bacterium]|nr:GerMN domain-containing protein [Candidatus Saccharimonadales bacterium]
MNTHPRPALLVLSLAALLVAACATSGGLGAVPTSPASPAPSGVTGGGSDQTPEPSDDTAPEPSPAIDPTPTPTPAGPRTSTPPATPVLTKAPSSVPTATPVGTMVVRAYYVLAGKPGVEGLVPTLREVPKSVATSRAAIEALLDGGPIHDAYPSVSTAIPVGTRLLDVAISNGVATVDLSSAFTSGGGSASMQYRLGQVVYTLTQFSSVKSVLFKVEGKALTTLGGEGLVLDGPQSRFDHESLLPEIFVDRPAFGAAIGNPARVTGNSNVFEATLRVAILDGSGTSLVDKMVTATCGSGCRGTFDVTLPYAVGKAQWGTLRVYYGSAMDGSPQGIRDYPVWLTPAT